MMKLILITSALLSGCVGAAQAQDQNEVVIFPQLAHSAVVTSVRFSPDSKALASGSLDATINLWDVSGGRELRTLTNGSEVYSIALSPDGTLLASGSGAVAAGEFTKTENVIKIWNVSDGRQILTLTGHTAVVATVAFSPDGKILASGSGDATVKLWDVASGRELRTFSGQKGPVATVAFSPDGKTLAAGSFDNTIKLWDIVSGRELRTLAGHNKGVKAIAFSPDGHLLASGGGEAAIKLWDPAHGRALRTLTGHTDEITSLAFSPDGRTLASGSVDKTVKLWEVPSGRNLHTLTGHLGPVASVAFSPDGKTFASGSADDTTELWDVASWSALRNLGRRTWKPSAIAVSPDGKLIVSGNTHDMIEVWDAASGQELRTLSGQVFGGNYYRINSVAFSPDGKILASGRGDSTVKLWNAAAGRELATLTGHTRPVSSIAFSPDGKLLASGSVDDTIKLWDLATGTDRLTLTGHTNWVSSVAFSPDGKVLASAGYDETIRLWDVTSGRELHVLSGHLGRIFSVAFSPDGKVLASGCENHTITLWDVANGRQLLTLTGHSQAVDSVAFSPDGKMLASGSYDSTIKLWDLASWRELRTLSANNLAFVEKVTFSPDGRIVVSINDDGTVREWDATSGRQRVALISFYDGKDYSHLAITPEGYFNSSSNQAEDNLNIRVGGRVFGIGSYREKFYRPDLVKFSLAGGSLTRFGSIGGTKLPPIVELVDLPQSTSQPKLNITLRLSDGGGGIGLIRVFLNGSAIIQDDTAGGGVMRSYAVPLSNGPNELRAVAFNADGSVQSNNAIGSIAAHLPPAQRGTLHAIVVGIQEFPKRPQNNLTYSVADAQLFADTLKKYSAPLFEKLDIRLLTTAAQTDKAHVVQALTDMQLAAGPDDEFVFYVASHGLVVDGEYYLITSNVSSAEAANLKAEAISRQQLAGLLANIQAPKKLVIIDTCHAQPVGDALQQALQGGGMTDSAATTILSRQIGSTVLAAATTDQEALEGYKEHGLFTRVVADGLAGQAAMNGIVSNFSLADYIGAEVPPLASNLYKHDQTPTVSATGQRFPIAEIK